MTTTNTHDMDDRIIKIDEDGHSSIHLTRDPKGQITIAIRDVPLPTTTSDLADSAPTFDAASQVLGSDHDGRGRVTDDGTYVFNWGGAWLSSYTDGSNTVSFTYDALGNRISRTEGGVTRDYVLNYALGLDARISVVREGGADLRYYIHTPDGSLLYSIEVSDNSRRDYHYDEMGNTLFLTDSGGDEIASYAHSPYGVPLGSTGDVDNPFTWQGQEGVIHEGDGRYYDGRDGRHYDSDSGRFISRDPVMPIDPNSNPYQYPLIVFNPQFSVGSETGELVFDPPFSGVVEPVFRDLFGPPFSSGSETGEVFTCSGSGTIGLGFDPQLLGRCLKTPNVWASIAKALEFTCSGSGTIGLGLDPLGESVLKDIFADRAAAKRESYRRYVQPLDFVWDFDESVDFDALGDLLLELVDLDCR